MMLLRIALGSLSTPPLMFSAMHRYPIDNNLDRTSPFTMNLLPNKLDPFHSEALHICDFSWPQSNPFSPFASNLPCPKVSFSCPEVVFSLHRHNNYQCAVEKQIRSVEEQIRSVEEHIRNVKEHIKTFNMLFHASDLLFQISTTITPFPPCHNSMRNQQLNPDPRNATPPTPHTTISPPSLLTKHKSSSPFQTSFK